MKPANRQAAALPHTGIATFCKAPYVFEPTEMQADVAILGVPFDNMASMRPGCRQAPRALRDASARFGWLGEPAGSAGFFDIGEGTTHLAGVRLVDAGDVDVRLDPAVTRERITAHARSIIDRGLLLASIGESEGDLIAHRLAPAPGPLRKVGRLCPTAWTERPRTNVRER